MDKNIKKIVGKEKDKENPLEKLTNLNKRLKKLGVKFHNPKENCRKIVGGEKC